VVSPFIKSKHHSYEKDIRTDIESSGAHKIICNGPELDYFTKENSQKSKTSTEKITLPRRKKTRHIFEELLVIGIEGTGLEYIDDLDEMLLSPKIIYNYPNCLEENELKL
jgi:hypothetical protein